MPAPRSTHGVGFAVGIDVGGTYLKAALVDRQGHVHDTERRRTRTDSAAVLIHDIIDAGATILRRASGLGRDVGGVGIALPQYSMRSAASSIPMPRPLQNSGSEPATGSNELSAW
jgi:predicted NBD/HSP70 family sugar kinase